MDLVTLFATVCSNYSTSCTTVTIYPRFDNCETHAELFLKNYAEAMDFRRNGLYVASWKCNIGRVANL